MNLKKKKEKYHYSIHFSYLSDTCYTSSVYGIILAIIFRNWSISSMFFSLESLLTRILAFSLYPPCLLIPSFHIFFCSLILLSTMFNLGINLSSEFLIHFMLFISGSKSLFCLFILIVPWQFFVSVNPVFKRIAYSTFLIWSSKFL